MSTLHYCRATLALIDLQMQQAVKDIDAIDPGSVDAVKAMEAYARHRQEVDDTT